MARNRRSSTSDWFVKVWLVEQPGEQWYGDVTQAGLEKFLTDVNTAEPGDLVLLESDETEAKTWLRAGEIQAIKCEPYSRD